PGRRGPLRHRSQRQRQPASSNREPQVMDCTTNPRRTLLLGAALCAATLAVFWPLTNYGFIMFDDWDYFVQNPMVQHGFRWQAVRWAFTTFHSGNWHPLTWLSYMLDTQL